jgi:hypothetical protein
MANIMINCAARAANVIKRNADRRVGIAALHSQIEIAMTVSQASRQRCGRVRSEADMTRPE